MAGRATRRTLQPQRPGPPLADRSADDLDPAQVDAAGEELEKAPPAGKDTGPDGAGRILPPWAGRPKSYRIRAVLDVLEARAAAGDTDAAKAVLSHYRWDEEMRKGRPALRGDIGVNHGVRVFDDLGQNRPAAAQDVGVRALPPLVIAGQLDEPTAKA